MISALLLHRYRVFEQAVVRLGPLTAFVGPNASGKSALLRACVGGRFDARDVRLREGWGAIGRVVGRRSSLPERGLVHHIDRIPPNNRVFFGDLPPAVTLSAPWHHAGHVVSVDVLQSLGPLLRLRADAMRQHCQVQEAPQLAADGGNLANVFATLPRREQERLSEAFCALVPVFGDVDVRPSAVGKHRLVFQDRWNPSLWYEPQDVSDGSLLALALLALRHQPKRPAMVAIEDPEHGVHPYLLGELVDAMRAMARDPERPVQFVLASHSPALLDHLRPEEVRFLTRHEAGHVEVLEPDPEDAHWRHAYEVHQESLASLWLSGGAGGVP